MTTCHSTRLTLALAALAWAVPEASARPPQGGGKPGDLPPGAVARLGTPRQHTLPAGAVLAAAYSHDGRQLATTGGKDGVTVWEAETWRKLAHFPVPDLGEEHPGPYVTSLDFSPDGK